MLRKFVRNTPWSVFSKSKALSSFSFSGVQHKEELMKISQMLKTKYFQFNEEIPQSASVRVIDDETNQFIGIFDTAKAL